MTLRRLMLLSLRRFWRTNLGVLLGVALASTVVTGALLVGDSMRYTLERTAEQRLGNISHAVITGERFMSDHMDDGYEDGAAGVMMLTGVASSPDGQARANDISVLGIDDNFKQFMELPITPMAGEAILNVALAQQLGLDLGDTLILRVPEPSALPIDAALVNASKPAQALRLTIRLVTNDDQGGRFSLRAEQRSPMNLYVNRQWLAEELGIPGRFNALLLDGDWDASPKLDDFELSLRESQSSRQELSTPRVFIDASIQRDLAGLAGQRLLTYMVNTVANGEKQSPYAMVTAADQLGGLTLADDEIALNSWLAEDIGASVGDTVTLTYFLPDEGDRLIESTTQLTVASIVPIKGAFADRTLTPDFPGLAEADQLSRWDAGPAIDRSRIRDKDEAYWDEYRATPKAFVNLRAGQGMWSNRFGTLTAIRFDNDITEAQLLERINAEALGFGVTDIKAQAEAAAVGTVDFGQLFLSLSGFIIIAAIVLAAMLFAMSVEQRARQLGTLLALGVTRRQVSRLIIGEGLVVALFGSLLGIAGAALYANLVIQALTGVWSGAVAGSSVLLHMTATSLTVGPLATLVVSLLAAVISIHGLTQNSARALLAGGVGRVSGPARIPKLVCYIFGFGGLAIAGLIVITNTQVGMRASLNGFTAGAACLAGGLVLLYALLVGRRAGPVRGALLRWHNSLALLSLTRRRGRTIAGVFMLGAGLFLVFAVSGFHLGTNSDPADRASGTGGFALLIETSQPIRYDLNTELGREHYALNEKELPPGSVVPIRVSDGDDASCLNLNQTPTPRLLGVDPALLSDRKAFSFFSMAPWDLPTTWDALNPDSDENAPIPAIADANTAQWALKIGVGDTFTVPNEQGQPVTLRLVGMIENSILQGSLIISEQSFETMFPSTSGHRLLLVDQAGGEGVDATADLLNEVLIDEGTTVTPTNTRLAEYNRVQNTYLVVFQSLGGLGVLLGSLGLGIVTARNLLERRSELALLSAVGIARGRIARILLTEHALILVLGLLLGSVSAVLATLHARDQAQPFGSLHILLFFAPLLAGLVAILLGLLPAMTGRITDRLRND